MRTVVSPLITFRGMLDVYQPCTNGLDSVFQKEIAPLGSVGNDDKLVSPCDRSWFGTQGMVWVSRSVFQLPFSSPAWIQLSLLQLGLISSSFAAQTEEAAKNERQLLSLE